MSMDYLEGTQSKAAGETLARPSRTLISLYTRRHNGFAVVDFATRKEIRRIKNPDLPPGKATVPEGSDQVWGLRCKGRGGAAFRFCVKGGQVAAPGI